MRTNTTVGPAIYVFDGANVLQGCVSITQGWWRYRPMNPSVPLGRNHAIRADALDEAAEWVDCLWPPPTLDMT